MKHSLKITFVILAMFIITQFIGLYVVNYYSPTQVINGEVVNVSSPSLPFGMQTPEIQQESDFYTTLLPSILISFVIAIFLLFILTKFKAELFLKLWFFSVIILALGIVFYTFIPSFKYASLFAAIIALPLAFEKVYQRNLIVHNLTELLIYPGIAAVFVPLFNLYTMIVILILISIYDMWAVWHSGIMQKMAKYQIDTLKIFSGFFVPYMSKAVRNKVKKMRLEAKENPEAMESLKDKKIKVNVAILGGGDVIFPIITAGVIMKLYGLVPALFVVLGATLGIGYLLFFAEKKKFYPAMPFITTGIFIGMILSWILTLAGLI